MDRAGGQFEAYRGYRRRRSTAPEESSAPDSGVCRNNGGIEYRDLVLAALRQFAKAPSSRSFEKEKMSGVEQTGFPKSQS
jgi:hypothetical protein